MVTKWDFDRMGSLLEECSDKAASLAADLDSLGIHGFEVNLILQRVEDVERAAGAVKTLLKRERLRKA